MPDGTYDLAEIRKIAHEWQHPMLPAGIECPCTEIEAGKCLNVIHTTGSGRLHWIVRENGNVRLEIYRPADLSPERAASARTMAYATISGVQPPDDAGICVARVWLINGDEDEQLYHPSFESFGFSTSEGDVDIDDSLCFERHISALVRPLVALLTANAPERKEGQDYAEWKSQYIRPAIEQAKKWLHSLFEKVLPDPSFFTDDERHEETYWTQPDQRARSSERDACRYVVHRGEKFPVESERAAVHAVLFLQQQPEMPLIEAIKAAIESDSYRPEAQ